MIVANQPICLCSSSVNYISIQFTVGVICCFPFVLLLSFGPLSFSCPAVSPSAKRQGKGRGRDGSVCLPAHIVEPSTDQFRLIWSTVRQLAHANSPRPNQEMERAATVGTPPQPLRVVLRQTVLQEILDRLG